MNLNKLVNKNRNLFVIALAIVITYIVCSSMKRSAYMPVNTSCGDKAPGSIFDTPCTADCVPGEKNGAYYTKDLTPCGKCGLQNNVVEFANCELTE